MNHLISNVVFWYNKEKRGIQKCNTVFSHHLNHLVLQFSVIYHQVFESRAWRKKTNKPDLSGEKLGHFSPYRFVVFTHQDGFRGLVKQIEICWRMVRWIRWMEEFFFFFSNFCNFLQVNGRCHVWTGVDNYIFVTTFHISIAGNVALFEECRMHTGFITVYIWCIFNVNWTVNQRLNILSPGFLDQDSNNLNGQS